MSQPVNFSPIPISSGETVASYCLQDPNNPEIELGQAKHRIDLVNTWEVWPGSRILEIGCGQGNCTAVLAEAVGPSGHVDAVDPAPGDYGAPFTLHQAQQYISASPIGDRITWHRAQPLDILATGTDKWDCAILSHCIWYFETPKVLEDLLLSLIGRVDRICIAEYALRASKDTALPHVLAAMARASIEIHKEKSEENIRTMVSPSEISRIARKVGWSLKREDYILPDQGLFDGFWEAGAVASQTFVSEIEATIKDPRVATLIRSERDAVKAAIERIGGIKRATTMDVWIGILHR